MNEFQKALMEEIINSNALLTSEQETLFCYEEYWKIINNNWIISDTGRKLLLKLSKSSNTASDVLTFKRFAQLSIDLGRR